MKQLVNYLRGVICVGVKGDFPERMINLCAQERIEFWSVEWENAHSLTMCIHGQSMKSLKKLVKRKVLF